MASALVFKTDLVGYSLEEVALQRQLQEAAPRQQWQALQYKQRITDRGTYSMFGTLYISYEHIPESVHENVRFKLERGILLFEEENGDIEGRQKYYGFRFVLGPCKMLCARREYLQQLKIGENNGKRCKQSNDNR